MEQGRKEGAFLQVVEWEIVLEITPRILRHMVAVMVPVAGLEPVVEWVVGLEEATIEDMAGDIKCRCKSLRKNKPAI